MRCQLVMVAVALAAAACERQLPATPPAATPPSAALAATPTRSTARLAGSFTGVHVLAEGADATLFYKTKTSLRDGAAQVAEMPIVWHEDVRGRLADARWTRVTLFPEEPSHTSAGFTFRLDRSGAWRADAPCLVTIAPRRSRGCGLLGRCARSNRYEGRVAWTPDGGAGASRTGTSARTPAQGMRSPAREQASADRHRP